MVRYTYGLINKSDNVDVQVEQPTVGGFTVQYSSFFINPVVVV